MRAGVTIRCRHAFVVVSLAAALTTLSGCSGQGSSTGSSPPTSTAPAQTTVTSGELAQQLTAAGAAKDTVEVLLERPKLVGQSGRLKVEGVVCLTDHSSSLTFEMDDLGGEVVTLGDVWYIKGLVSAPGRPWVRPPKEPPVAPAHLPQDLFGEVAGLIQANDLAGLTTFGTDIAFVQQPGSAIPDTRQLVAKVPAEIWLATVPAARHSELKDWIDLNRITEFSWTVNVASDGLPVQQTFNTLPNLNDLTIQVRYLGWGSPCAAKAPDPSKVVPDPADLNVSGA